MSLSKPVTFPKFLYLANEIQDLIWEWSLKDRPPGAHFAELGSHQFKSRLPNGEVASSLTATLIENLTWSRLPPEFVEVAQRPETHLDILLRTCKQSRRAAIRHRKSWGPEGTLQLYDPHDERRENVLDLARDFGIPKQPYPDCLHFEFKPPKLFDLPSFDVDTSRDLVILEHYWIGTTHGFQSSLARTRLEWMMPVPRIPYLALTYTTRFHEFLDRQLLLVAHLLRFRVEVLYLLINPDEFNDNRTAVKSKEERDMVKARRKALETPFPKREGAESLIARAPDNFWYGSREYYAFSWDDFEKKMMASAHWRKFGGAIEKARQMEKDCCDGTGCQDAYCNKRAETFPAIWKIMSWRDHE
ncbi:hypothetical protein N0V84_005148 [Fusarium piperis]|uniref:Uncharacterized protein n=1 Tax=Fusarium piperis TaxID=1435070 RepID=A0A9W8WED5_9HYPO|nr:hypothetical protein N0V84_005148 [Fusarium piperis]